jgi:hypothetical protein
MHDNYFNLHKWIINNHISEKLSTVHYNLSQMREQSYNHKLDEYKSLTKLTFVAFEKYMWIWIQSSIKFIYYDIGTTIPKITHKSTFMIELKCQAYT